MDTVDTELGRDLSSMTSDNELFTSLSLLAPALFLFLLDSGSDGSLVICILRDAGLWIFCEVEWARVSLVFALIWIEGP